MKESQVKMNMLVSVNDLDDGGVYEVVEITGRSIGVKEVGSHTEGKDTRTQHQDCSIFQKATTAQKKNAGIV